MESRTPAPAIIPQDIYSWLSAEHLLNIFQSNIPQFDPTEASSSGPNPHGAPNTKNEHPLDGSGDPSTSNQEASGSADKHGMYYRLYLPHLMLLNLLLRATQPDRTPLGNAQGQQGIDEAGKLLWANNGL